MDLIGKAALVTGGASGIGAAAVRRLAAAGAVVAVADQDEAGARSLAEEVGGLALPGDVTQHDTMAMSIDVAEDTFGRLNIVLLNAGVTAGQSGVEDLDLARYRRIMGVNVDHVVFGLTSAVPALRRAGGGHIVATASLAGLVPMPGDALYTLTKHAVVGYVRSVAPTLAPEGIRVNAVCPGFADTPLIANAKAQFGDFPLLSADDVAGAIEGILERGGPGECWFVQPGREPAPYGFRGVPGPKGGIAPPLVDWEDH
ncbi:SDR family oxidoreductase [Pseudonocardia asaccharolytica]|uniref:Dehydrogenase n=1 Tax=Pseudonocardia asaccharolytica DSM 44247 = NBRC 16224 TaxID=1123024 RepID=A0A511D0M7_9PSEU|nr:SDR family oxidoreductase [Pseudonocardia asaccharolytica]GEL18332.1 dehydrogenase [Pseudonocardia asaccharolytica DSM 44247 = NBRC 16224]